MSILRGGKMDKKEYHGHPDFYKLLDKMRDIHSAKNHDYSGEGDPFRNFKISETMGIPAWKGCLIRLSDKFSRLCSFARKEDYQVKDESIEDTLLDNAIYSLICILLYREYKKSVVKPDNDCGNN
jgi:hypothetical protein